MPLYTPQPFMASRGPSNPRWTPRQAQGFPPQLFYPYGGAPAPRARGGSVPRRAQQQPSVPMPMPGAKDPSWVFFIEPCCNLISFRALSSPQMPAINQLPLLQHNRTIPRCHLSRFLSFSNKYLTI